MNRPYFLRAASQTPTREHMELAIANGATGCTTNPSHSQKMLDHPVEGSDALHAFYQALRESDNDAEVAAILQRKLVSPVAEKFMAIYARSDGNQGGAVSSAGTGH
jgi:hypothetical protein